MKKFYLKFLLLNFLFAGVFIFDRLIKLRDGLHPGLTVFKIGPVHFFFEYFHNPNIAFSLPLPIWLSLIFSIIVVPVIIYFLARYIKQKQLACSLGLSLVVWGAVSNFYDRLVHGYVIDYLNLDLNIFSWPVFNLADLMIVIGVVIFLFNTKKIKTDSNF